MRSSEGRRVVALAIGAPRGGRRGVWAAKPLRTMAISQEEATKIAQEFMRPRLAQCPVKLDSPFARREQVRGRPRWVIMFDRILPPGVVQSPEEVIVLVDELSGTPEIELAL